MRNLDLDFLTHMCEESHILTGEEIQVLVANVLSVLRENRGTGKLSDEEVLIGNRFILAMNFLMLNNELIQLNITTEDLDIIMAENEFMRMGHGRN